MSSTKATGALVLRPTVLKTENGGRRVPAELGRLTVPERRGRPGGGTLDLAFGLLRSRSRQPGPPMIFLAGGPGGAGIRALCGDGMADWYERVRANHDVIGLDQRGVGQTQPALDSPLRWDLPLDEPGSRAGMLEVARARSRALRDFWTERGVDLSGYVTTESADDVDAVRAALGAEQMILFGGSYGSHLGLATLRRHGPRVERAILGLVEGPDHTIKRPANIQRHLERLAVLARADARVDVPDLLGLMHEVLERLGRSPVRVEAEDRRTGTRARVCVGKFDLQLVTARGLGSAAQLRRLPSRYQAMAGGDYSWVATEVLGSRTSFFPSAMSCMMDCASGASPARRARIRAEAEGCLLGDLIDFPLPDMEDAWGGPDLGDEFRQDLSSTVPTLLVSGTLDGRTPVDNATEVARGLSQARQIVVDGMAHSLADATSLAPVRDAMLEFLAGREPGVTRGTLPFEFEPSTG